MIRTQQIVTAALPPMNMEENLSSAADVLLLLKDDNRVFSISRCCRIWRSLSSNEINCTSVDLLHKHTQVVKFAWGSVPMSKKINEKYTSCKYYNNRKVFFKFSENQIKSIYDHNIFFLYFIKYDSLTSTSNRRDRSSDVSTSIRCETWRVSSACRAFSFSH